MSAYRLRRAGREFLVIDRDSLLQMAQNGQVRNGDDVWFQERWQPVGALPDLQGKLGADPWAAWDDGDAAPADSLVARYNDGRARGSAAAGPGALSGTEPGEAEPDEIEPEAISEVPRRLVLRARPSEPEEVVPDPEDPADEEGDEVETTDLEEDFVTDDDEDFRP